MSIHYKTKFSALFFATVTSFIFPNASASEPIATTETTTPQSLDLDNTPFVIPTPSPSFRSSLSKVSTKETNFRQEFLVGESNIFDVDDVLMLEMLYRRYMEEYSPEFDASSKITTTFTVHHQSILNVDPDIINETEDHLLLVDYTIKFSSPYYNVTSYPKLFQEWSSNNLDTMLIQMKSLRLDVITLNGPMRIVVSTPAPSVVPTTVPTNSPSASNVGTAVPSIPQTSLDSTSSSNIVEEKQTNGSNITRVIILSIALSPIILAPVYLIVLCLSKWWKNKTASCDSKDDQTTSDLERGGIAQEDDDSTNTSMENDPEHGESRAGSPRALTDLSFGRMESIEIK